MSDAPPPQAPVLDLERATFDAEAARGRMRCAFCDRELHGSYFDVSGKPACEGCRYRLEDEQARGAGVSGFFKALGAGAAAALAGFLLYWLIEELTGYEFGLIAIVVGILVGRAVRWGSGHRGGWVFQTMAVVLTYLAITCTYIPMMLKELRAEKTPPAAAAAGATPTSATDAPAPAAAGSQAAPAAPEAAAKEDSPPSPGEFFIGLGVLIGLAAAMPFLGGASNLLGILILGFGVWEAWKLNRRRKLTITGPLSLGDRPGAAVESP